MSLPRPRVLQSLAAAALVVVPIVMACGGAERVTGNTGGGGGTPPPGGNPGTSVGPAANLVVVGGNNQPDTTVGSTLKDSLVVRVTDANGNGVRSSTVTWAVASGGGSVSPATSTTDVNGRAATRWTLGPAKGAQTVTATVAQIAPVTFSMNAKGGAVATIAKLAGDDQAALVNLALGNPLKVRVLDSFGNPVQDAVVTWTAAGDGAATPTLPRTDVNGEVTATWKLGSTPGAQTLQVSANGKSVAFNATASIEYASVDAGGFDSCGITPSAQAFCWGYNGDGQLGIGSITNRNVPTAVSTPLTFRQLSGGKYHTCGITLSGIAYCWGSNVDGRLGTNNLTPSLVPVQTATPVTFDSVSSGLLHTCGLSRSGLVYCWGFNQEGEVGASIPPNDSITVKVPRPVSGQAFRSVSTGGMHACALDRGNGTAWCWGFNTSGQLGDGTTGFGTLNNTPTATGATSLPVAVSGGRSWKSIASGYRHTCALATDGTAWCWGEGTKGQLGNGSTANVSIPTAVMMPGGVTFTDIAAGEEHTCAVAATTGAIYCWGSNESGQLGNTGASTLQTMPIQVSSTLAFTSVSAGEVLTCGVTTAKAVYCWGSNDYGQLGNATNIASGVPVKGAYQP